MDLSATSEDRERLLVTDAEYSVESGHKTSQPVVHLFCRDADGDRRRVDVEGFRPYFYIEYQEFVDEPLDVINDRHVIGVEANFEGFQYVSELDAMRKANDPDDVASILTELSSGDTRVYHESDTNTTIDDDRLVKVYTVEPSHVGKIREHWDPTYEADIPFERRFLISTDIRRGIEIPEGATRVRYENWQGHSGSESTITEIEPTDPPAVDPRLCIVDIEVATHGGGIPDPDRARNEITAITAYDSYTGEYAGWLLEHDDWNESGPTESELEDAAREEIGVDLDQMNVYERETIMMEEFNQWVDDRGFDMLSGWNSEYFDYPYIVNRSYELNAYTIREWDELGNPGAWRDDDRDEMNVKIDGRVTWDMLTSYKKTQFRDLRSYSLEYVAQEELGMGKAEIDDDLDDAWANSPVDFMVYNVRDVQAVVQIEHEQELLDLYDNLRRVTGAMYDTCHNNGPMLDTLFLREAYDSGLALPTNQPVPPEEGNYPGAWVAEPVPGKHDNCVYPDLSSLYPSLFSMLNLGQETIIGSETDVEQSDYTFNDVFRVPIDRRGFKTVPKGEPYDDIDKDKYKGVLSSDGGLREMFEPRYDDLYVLKPEIKESFITRTIDDLIDLKYQYTGNKYSAVKRVTNSCFTPDTEVLTPDGVKNVTDISVGDDVYTLDPDSGEMVVKPVVDTITKNDYSGEMYNITSGNYDVTVTADHNLTVRRKRHNYEWEVMEAQEVAQNKYTQYELPSGWIGEEKDELDEIEILNHISDEDVWVHADPSVHGRTFVAEVDGDVEREGNRSTYRMRPDVYRDNRQSIDEMSESITLSATNEYSRVPSVIDGSNAIKLVCWLATESNTYETNDNSVQTFIAQQDPSGREEIEALLESIGFDYKKSDDGFTVTSRVLGRFTDNVVGVGSESKKVPEWIFQSSLQQRRTALNTLVHGDGQWLKEDESRARYTTQSKELRDQFIRLCVELGSDPKYTYVENGDVYRVWYHENEERQIRSNRNIESEEVSGETVHCFTAKDNHTIFAGRNGKFMPIRQCYGVMGDSKSGGKGFRLFDRKIAEGITLSGRRTIEFTADEFTEHMQDEHDEDAYLVGGDTDAAVTSVPNASDLGTVKDWSDDAIDHVTSEYDRFVREEFDMSSDDEHRLDVELESVASGLFYMQDDDDIRNQSNEDDAVKKRYAQHIVWDDDDGWIDLPDSDETNYDVLDDPEDRSALKEQESVGFDTYESGVLSDSDPYDDVSITGFEYVRSDTATVTKEAQQEILAQILLADDPVEAIDPYLNDLIDSIKTGDRPIEDLGRPKGVNKALDEYGWKSVEELEDDTNYTVTETDRANGGRYVATPGPTYRGRKYAIDHIPWEDGAAKSVRLYIESVDPHSEFPEVYEYDQFPRDERPDPPEVEREVDAITVENPDRLPSAFEPDTEKMIRKELRRKLEPILVTIDQSWDGIVGDGRQVGLDAF